ncbi:DUF4235 domain-containing protein [Isoptericola sp. b441]|uniref:DUF4235 domain-containing protein n=1 Tax=Actinotalea lenta TaxID=3064654 RepID=A0ABT9D633_9CELL|nr:MULTISPECIES: DUF4235 domain-containing protein [unclassified Isoptericola]MDO8106277.1 DUF4235 domain-containing protein [Isoptericola sp. b441]MDO8122003.1 DUF4235 domain-containing protein [Isoptericola sp. b490]
MSDDKSESRIAKLVGLAAAAGAAWAAGKLIDSLWTKAFGHAPPKADDDSDDIRFREVAAAAVISGAIVALFRASATRGARKLIG